MTTVRLRSKVDNWESLTGTTRTRVGKVVRQTAQNAQAAAQRAAPVDAGTLRASIYAVTSGASGFAASEAEAGGAYRARHNGDPPLFPAYEPQGQFKAAVVVGANYGFWIENGTSKNPPRPFLMPAVNAQADAFEAALKKAVG